MKKDDKKIHIITFEDIKRLNIDPKICFQWVSNAIKQKEKTLLPPKISIKPFDGAFCNVMPCITEHTGGVKVVTRYPNRKPSLNSLLMLLDVTSGEILALMDANWITAMRTGAVAVHSMMLFAKKRFSTVGILGLGNTARSTLLVLAEMMPEHEFRIKLLRYKGQEELYAKRFASYHNLHFEFIDRIDLLIKGSDVVVSAATYLPNDLCDTQYFDEGILVIPIHTRGFTNCDLFFDKIYADDHGHVCHFKNFSHFRYFAEVDKVVSKKAAGRENDRERILVYNIGIAMYDIYFAYHIYQLLKERIDLPEIDMHAPMDKFWI